MQVNGIVFTVLLFLDFTISKNLIASFFLNNKKNALIEKGHKKLCSPYFIAENRYN